MYLLIKNYSKYMHEMKRVNFKKIIDQFILSIHFSLYIYIYISTMYRYDQNYLNSFHDKYLNIKSYIQ